ncbi:MAG: hypothetical protein AAGC54_03965 [Cyanobacteria bacterium P01_F01_bin.4]
MLILLSNTLSWIETQIRIATRVEARSLSFFRIVFGVFTMLFLWRRYVWLGAVPDAFFNPPLLSITSFFWRFPPAPFFQGIDLLVGICTVTLTIGLMTRASTLGLLVLLLLGNNFQFSLGKIDHTILYPCVLLVMCFQNWGAFFSVDALRQRLSPSRQLDEAANLSLLGLFIAFGFFTAGFGKALNWVDFDLSTNGFLSWLYRGYYNFGSDQLLAPLAIQVNLPILWELVDYSAVIFELGFCVAILGRRSWYLWLTIACLFHLMNCLLLNIPFNDNAIAYLAFIPWARLPVISKLSSQKLPWVLAGLGSFSIFALVLRISSEQVRGIAFYLSESIGFLDGLLLSCGIWVISLLIFLLNFNKYVALSGQASKVMKKNFPIPH